MVPYVHEGYVARVQSVGDYYLRSMDLLDPAVRADLFDPLHPIRTKDQSNPSTYYGPDSKATSSLVADGCHVDGEIENCVLFRGVTVEAGAKVSNSVLMQGTVVKAGASLSYVLTDKNVQINEGRLLMGHSNYPLAIAKGAVV
jgi:glucose-1-phosphate adenylyltransferase